MERFTRAERITVGDGVITMMGVTIFLFSRRILCLRKKKKKKRETLGPRFLSILDSPIFKNSSFRFTFPSPPLRNERACDFTLSGKNARCSGPAILRDEGHRRVRLARQHGNLEVSGAELCGGFRRRDRVAGCRGRIHVLCQQPRRKGYSFSLSLSSRLLEKIFSETAMST